MATYGQLLIGSGGGVIDRNKQSKRQKGATVIIGLGGTGGHAAQMIKREVYRQLMPDDPDSEIIEYKNIKYLIVDTDPSEYKDRSSNPADIDNKREFFDISYDAIAHDFSKNNWPILASNKAMNWLNYENINPDTAKAGAGGVRQVGRYLLVKNSFELYNRIENEISNAMRETDSPDVHVHICAGISGGTGSGTFLDVCYLVRRALKNLGVRGAEICGYFFLPDVNLTQPSIMHDPTIQSYIRVNGYAAMQELDYCMNLDKNNDAFVMDYGNSIKIEDTNKPVDLCYLISATNRDGQVINNGYNYAMNVVTDHVISFLSKVELPEGVSAGNDNGMTLEGHIANIKRARGAIKTMNGAINDYNILGASVAEMPLSEIATYLGVKLFDNIQDIYNKVPTKAERNGFQAMLKMTYDDIFRAFMTDCASQIPFGKKYDGGYLREKGVGPFNLLHNDTYDHNCGIMERNAKAMMEELGDYHTSSEGTGTSLISRLFKALYERCVLSSDFGPFYAKRMLYGANNDDMYKAVLGLIEENRERTKSEQIQEQHLREELDIAKEKAENANFINAGACADRLCDALNAYCMHMCRLTAYEKLERVLTTFRDQITELDQRLFNVLTTIMNNLNDTFKENAKVFAEGIEDNNIYTWKILSITEVASQLDSVIQDMDVRLVLLNMMRHMFEQVDEWTNEQDDNKISKIISDFILKEFAEATKKTMTDYLHIRYKTSTNQQLASEIDKDIMQDTLWDKSTPLFWQSPSYGETIVTLSTLSIPYDSQPIELATGTLKQTKGATVRKTNLTDKISLMRFLSGIPMYAYNGLENLEIAYENDKNFGRHLFEREVDWNKLLPSPIPYSVGAGRSDRQITKNGKIVALWNEAKEKGIIEADERGLWHINCLGSLDLAGLEAEYNSINKSDVVALMAFGDKAKKAGEDAKASKVVTDIKVDSVLNDYEEQASIDYFIKAPKLVEIVEKEMETRNKLAEFISSVDEGASASGKMIGLKDDFFNAIFTGVITHEPLSVKYISDNFGMKEEIILSSPDMKLGKSSTYQAFQTFMSLDSAVLEKVSTEANAALISSDPEVVARKTASMNFIATKLETLINTAYVTHPSVLPIRNEVMEFYKDFMKAYQDFKRFN